MRFLLVDDDPTLRMTVRMTLESQHHEVCEAENGRAALALFKEAGPFDAVILDVNMPEMDGITTLENIKSLSPETFCLIMTAYANLKDAVRALKHGAYDYLEKPVESEKLLQLIDEAIQARSLIQIAGQSAPSLHFDDGKRMIGQSSSIKEVFAVIDKLSRVDTSVLIRGESGTGKELVAQALHFNSHRKKQPFIAVNCAAIPETLIESELFGHEKGAFTGADRKKAGRFQAANGGTIFLDEIGDMSIQMQVKLLRVLQERKITPVGSNSEIDIDVRVIAATSRPLEQMIQEGSFRPDLFYRLNILPVILPPLRERREDIESLTRYMINKFNESHNRQIKGVTKEALNALRLYHWPGNIRELENVIEHAFILEPTDTLGLESLPKHIQTLVNNCQTTQQHQVQGSTSLDSSSTESSTGQLLTDVETLDYPTLKEQFEREFIIRALKAFNGRINQTAASTKMTKVTLLRKLEKYGIDPKEFRQ